MTLEMSRRDEIGDNPQQWKREAQNLLVNTELSECRTRMGHLGIVHTSFSPNVIFIYLFSFYINAYKPFPMPFSMCLVQTSVLQYSSPEKNMQPQLFFYGTHKKG